jgi:hypothetical protein
MLALGVLSLPMEALAQSGDISFNGELNYAAFRSAASRGQTVTIRYSPGGTGAAALALARVSKVVVDGPCNSACAWSFVRNANACFTPRARFGFHAAHDPGTGRRLNAATSYWLQGVRPSLKGKLGALLSTSSLIKVSASEMRRHYGDRVCGSEPRTEIASLEVKRSASEAVLSRTAKTRSNVGKADTVVAEAAVTSTLLPIQSELVAAIDLLSAREETRGLMVDGEGALSTLLSATQLAETGLMGRELLLFAKAPSSVMTTAQSATSEGEAAPKSLSLLYRREVTFA